MKRKHKKQLAIAGVVVGLLLLVTGAWMKGTLPAEPSMSEPDWFSRTSAIHDREFNSFVLMGGGGFLLFVAISELLRQAKKLKV